MTAPSDLIVEAFVRYGYTAVEGRRFARKVQLDPVTGCWEWTGCLNSKGYGCLGLRKVAWLAHRLAHIIFIGPIPDGHQVDHVRDKGCKSTACVNPAHLEAVTGDENMARRWDSWYQQPHSGPKLVDLTTPRPLPMTCPPPSAEDRYAAELLGAHLDGRRAPTLREFLRNEQVAS